ncbi:MAG: hypothetical protein [Bacteriophage sp.]|nr:MAG: hypothetical protein [Bacteriophage sp.]
MADETLFITVNSFARIPFININGPISTPIAVSKTVYENLVKMGYNIEVHDSRSSLDNEVKIEDTSVTVETELAEETDVDTTNTNAVEASPVVLSEKITTIDEPKELSTVVMKAEDLETEDEVVEEVTEASEELAVYELSVYKKWNISKLISYLESAKDYLDEETFNSLQGMSKTELLDVVKEKIIPMAE